MFSVIEKVQRPVGRPGGPLATRRMAGHGSGLLTASRCVGQGLRHRSLRRIDGLGLRRVGLDRRDPQHLACQCRLRKRSPCGWVRATAGPCRLPPPLDSHEVDSGARRARMACAVGHRDPHDHRPRFFAVRQLPQTAIAARSAGSRLSLGRNRQQPRRNAYAGIPREKPERPVPIIELDDGRVMAESNAILCWLAEGTSFLPDDSWQRAQALSWMFFEQYSHEPYIAVARFIRGWTPLDSPRRAEPAELHERGHQALARDGATPGGSRVVHRPEYGIADIALFAYTDCRGRWWFRARGLSGCPRLARSRTGDARLHCDACGIGRCRRTSRATLKFN